MSEPTASLDTTSRRRAKGWMTEDMPGYSRITLRSLMSRAGNLNALLAPDGTYHLWAGRGEPLALIFNRRKKVPVDVLTIDHPRMVYLAIERGAVPMYLHSRAPVAEQRKTRRAWNDALIAHEKAKSLDRWRPTGWRAFTVLDEN